MLSGEGCLPGVLVFPASADFGKAKSRFIFSSSSCLEAL